MISDLTQPFPTPHYKVAQLQQIFAATVAMMPCLWVLICALAFCLGQDLLSAKNIPGLSDKCAGLLQQTVVRPAMGQCLGRISDPSHLTREISYPRIEEEEPGIFAEDCLGGCFVRVRPGPNKLCLCLNATAAHHETCNQGKLIGSRRGLELDFSSRCNSQ